MIWQNEFNNLILEANLAPTVHNVQPARWKLTASTIELYFDKNCAVPVADPHNRDLQVSLGANIEGMKLALLRRGYATDIQLVGIESQPIAIFTPKEISESPSSFEQILLDQVEKRQSYRGTFSAASTEKIANFKFTMSQFKPQLTVLTEKKEIGEIAELYDKANFAFYQNPKFLKELNGWLRFKKNHSRYAKDGLNSKAMAMDGLTAAVAQWIMHPRVFKALDQLGIAQSLVSESKANLSASAILIFKHNKSDSYLTTGQILYRLWLTASSVGFSFCPISSVTDNLETRKKIQNIIVPDKNLEILIAFRAGPAPIEMYKRSRRDIEELVSL